MEHTPRLLPCIPILPLLFLLHRLFEVDAYACRASPPDPDVAQLHISLVITNLTVIVPTRSLQSACSSPMFAHVVAASLRLNGMHFNVSTTVVLVVVLVVVVTAAVVVLVMMMKMMTKSPRRCMLFVV